MQVSFRGEDRRPKEREISHSADSVRSDRQSKSKKTKRRRIVAFERKSHPSHTPRRMGHAQVQKSSSVTVRRRSYFLITRSFRRFLSSDMNSWTSLKSM